MLGWLGGNKGAEPGLATDRPIDTSTEHAAYRGGSNQCWHAAVSDTLDVSCANRIEYAWLQALTNGPLWPAHSLRTETATLLGISAERVRDKEQKAPLPDCRPRLDTSAKWSQSTSSFFTSSSSTLSAILRITGLFPP